MMAFPTIIDSIAQLVMKPKELKEPKAQVSDIKSSEYRHTFDT